MKIHKNLQESCQNLWSLEASNIFLFMISNWSTHNIEESLKEVEWSERHVQESSQISGKDPANMRSSPRFSINLTRQYWYLKNPPSISEASQNRLEKGGGERQRILEESWKDSRSIGINYNMAVNEFVVFFSETLRLQWVLWVLFSSTLVVVVVSWWYRFCHYGTFSMKTIWR